MTTNLPHGLYYVDRDEIAYLLTAGQFPALSDLDMFILSDMIGNFASRKGRDAYDAVARPDVIAEAGKTPSSEFEPSDDYSNMIGGPFGVYYVTLDGRLFDLTDDGYPPLGTADRATLMAYVKYSVRAIRLVLQQ